MTEPMVPEGVEVRRFSRKDGTVTEVFSVRVTDIDGTRRRRSFDSLVDALDYRARLRSARRWRPEELRQEQAGTQTLGAFFEQWWVERAMAELARATLAVYRCLWEAHAAPRLARLPMREIDARRVVAFRGELLASGVGPTSVVKTMAMLQRVFRDAVEYGDVAFNPFKAVRKPSPGPSRVARPLTPLQVERLVADLERRGSRVSAVLVRLMAYTGLRPQEALALHWYAVRKATLLVELANADGQLDRLKNRKRSRKRSRTVDLITADPPRPSDVAAAVRSARRRRAGVPPRGLRPPVVRRRVPQLAPARLRSLGRGRRPAVATTLRPAPHLGFIAHRREAAVDRRGR